MIKARRGRDDIQHSGSDTVISKDVSFQGTIQASGVLRIDGRIQGNIDTQGDVIIGKDGVVNAHVRAANVVVAGHLQGDVDVSGRLQILPGGKLFGDAKVGVLVVEEGAIFKGQCEMELQRPGESSKRISRRVDTTGGSDSTRQSDPAESPDPANQAKSSKSTSTAS